MHAYFYEIKKPLQQTQSTIIKTKKIFPTFIIYICPTKVFRQCNIYDIFPGYITYPHYILVEQRVV